MQGPFRSQATPGIVSAGLEQFQEKCVAVFLELRKNKNV
jgi:hypothetical protein